MIKIDFTSAVSFYISFAIALVFIMWVFYNFYRNGGPNEVQHLHQCPYCTYMFFDYRSVSGSKQAYPGETSHETAIKEGEETVEGAEKLLICPRCQSYINLNAPAEQGENG